MSRNPELTLADRERGKRIKSLRLTRNESQAEFGSHFSVEQATVSRWEEGWPVRRKYWDGIATMAGVNAADFFLGQQIDVPLLSWVSASALADVGEVPHPKDAPAIWVSSQGLPAGDYFALKVRGDSMDRVAPDESTILVNRSDTVLAPGRFYVFQSAEGATFKRFCSDPARLEPYSTNPTHTIIFPKRELIVIGRVRRVMVDL